jgi:hypothetical protein
MYDVMPSQGRPIYLVRQYAEEWRIEDWNLLPHGLRGVYVLLDRHHTPVYVGRSGGGNADLRTRINTHRRESNYGPRTRFFSAYVVDRGYIKQMETFLLRAVGDLLRWNTNKGYFGGATIIEPLQA